MINDAFSRLNTSGDFKKFVSEIILTETDKNENIIKIPSKNLRVTDNEEFLSLCDKKF